GMTPDGRACKGPRGAEGCPFPTRPEGNQCTVPATFPASAKLSVANALMLTNSGKTAVSPDYVATVKVKYPAEVFKDITVATVNDWVKRKTEGKIDKILDRLDESSAAVLLNAVYFKAAWATPFTKSATREEQFHLTASKRAKVPTMNMTASFVVVTQP